MKQVKTKYIASLENNSTFSSIINVDVTSSFDAQKVKTSPLLVCEYIPRRGLGIVFKESARLYYNEDGYSIETLKHLGYLKVLSIKEVKVFEEEEEIFKA